MGSSNSYFAKKAQYSTYNGAEGVEKVNEPNHKNQETIEYMRVIPYHSSKIGFHTDNKIDSITVKVEG